MLKTNVEYVHSYYIYAFENTKWDFDGMWSCSLSRTTKGTDIFGKVEFAICIYEYLANCWFSSSTSVCYIVLVKEIQLDVHYKNYFIIFFLVNVRKYPVCMFMCYLTKKNNNYVGITLGWELNNCKFLKRKPKTGTN